MFTFENQNNCIVFTEGGKRLRIAFVNPAIVRVTFIEGRPFAKSSSLIVTSPSDFTGFEIMERDKDFLVSTEALHIEISKQSGSLRFLSPQGRLLVQEPWRGGKWLTPKDIYRNVYDPGATASSGENIDGARAEAAPSMCVFDRHAFEAKLEFVFADQEALFGFGSHEEGYGNLRGKSRELYQQNMKAVVPCFVSTKGYAVLVDCSSLMTFHDDAHGSYVWMD